MPRQSSAAREMAAWQPEHEPPPSPAHLTAAARRLWDDIIADRPAGHFRPGSFSTLATFCEVSAQLVRLWRRERACRSDPEAHGGVIRHICRLATLQARLCGDLRLTPRATIERHSAQRHARGVWTRDPLLQGKRKALDS
jgi:hypothetical protein